MTTSSRTATADRLLAIEERLGNIEAVQAAKATMIEEIRTAVIGDGSKDSSLRERVASLETSNDWRHRGAYSIVPSLLVAVLAHVGIHVPGVGGQP